MTLCVFALSGSCHKILQYIALAAHCAATFEEQLASPAAFCRPSGTNRGVQSLFIIKLFFFLCCVGGEISACSTDSLTFSPIEFIP